MVERVDAIDVRAFLARGARAFYDRVVLSHGAAHWRRDAVEQEASTIAVQLAAAGVQPGDAVAAQGHGLVARLLLHRAILLAGGVEVDAQRHPRQALRLARFSVALQAPGAAAVVQRQPLAAPAPGVAGAVALVPLAPTLYGADAAVRGDHEVGYAGLLSTYLLGRIARPLLAVGPLGQSSLEALAYVALIAGEPVQVVDGGALPDDAQTVVIPAQQLAARVHRAQTEGEGTLPRDAHWVAVLELDDLAAFGPQAVADLARRLPADRLRVVLASGAHGWFAEFDGGRGRWRPLVGADLAVDDGAGPSTAEGGVGGLRLRAPQASAHYLSADGAVVQPARGWAGVALAARVDAQGFAFDVPAPARVPQWVAAGTGVPVNGISVSELLTRGSRWHPDRPAVKFQGSTWSYAQVRERVGRLRHALREELGLRAGDRLAVLLRNGPAFIEAYWAANGLGLVFVPLNFRLKDAEVRYALEDSGARALLVDEDLRTLGCTAAAGTGALERVIAVDGLGPDSYAALLQRAQVDTLEQEAPDEEAPASILYTAGTTGFPKGAVRSNRNAIWFGVLGLPMITRAMPHAAMLLTTPMFHVAGQEPQVIGGMANAGLAVILRELRVDTVLDHLVEDRVSFLFVPPTVGFELVERIAQRDLADKLPDFLFWQSASAPLPEVLRNRIVALLPWVKLQNALGMTEAGGLAYYIVPPGDFSPSGTIGRAFPGADTRVLDERGHEVPPGQPGEIVNRSPQVISTYWNKPEATAKTLRGGWLWGGDIGFVDAAGNIEIKGRNKDMIITGGENVYSVEVENVLLRMPELREAAVFGLPDDKWGETVHAAVVLRDGAILDGQSVVDRCRAQIAHYKCPRRVIFLEALPRNALGKVTKYVLQQQHTATPAGVPA